MDLPPLSHLQFLVIDILGAKEAKGKELRHALAKKGTKKSGPAFYQMMNRLKDSNFVKARTETKVVEGQTIKETVYIVTGEGRKAWDATKDFYAAFLTSSGEETHSLRTLFQA